MPPSSEVSQYDITCLLLTIANHFCYTSFYRFENFFQIVAIDEDNARVTAKLALGAQVFAYLHNYFQFALASLVF